MKMKFQGLIAHVTLDEGTANERQVAAIVAAPDHTGRLSAKNEFVDDSNGLGKPNTTNDGTCFALTGRVTFPGLPSGKAAEVVRGGMPSLLQVTNGVNFSPELSAANPDPAVFQAVIDLPAGGRLAPGDYFREEVRFNANHHGPMPRTMEYHVATFLPNNLVTVNINGTDVVLTDDAEITISNLCENGESDGLHFDNYKLLFNPPATDVHIPIGVPEKPCSFGTHPGPLPGCAPSANVQVDCGNGGLP